MTYEERAALADEAGLIPADHSQLWSDEDLERAALRERRLRAQLEAEARLAVCAAPRI